MPFDNVRSLACDEPDRPDVALAEAALARFRARHPYLLFRNRAVPALRRLTGPPHGLRSRSTKPPIKSPVESPAAAVPQDPRTAIKRQARQLIATSFVALTADGAAAEAALAATCEALDGFAAAASWKARPVIRSFLDCAEIAVAVSLAYDWLFHKLSPGRREAIESAIRRNVLDPALAAYQDRSLLWPKRCDNCTLVSNSGILIAALAVLRPYRALSAELVRHSLASSWHAFSALAPDGAWREGLSYWSLAMRYAALMVAALESTLGTSLGLAGRPGFAETGDFALHAAGPFGAAFNFGDSDQRFDLSPLAWHAHRFGRPIDRWLLHGCEARHAAFAAIWPKQAGEGPVTLGLPTGKVFRSGDLACFRNTWSSAPPARQVYLAIKGGNLFSRIGGGAPRPEDVALHAQADAGTFVLDGARHRWVVDLGGDDYDLPGYFDHGKDARSGRRWQYYRSQAAGHNTLTINGRDQVPNAAAAIIGSCTEGDCKWAVFELSGAYGLPPGTVRRGAALIGRQVVIQDEADPAACRTIVWAMHTSAEPVALAGSLARFRLGADCLVARILEPVGARFELVSPPAPRSFALDAATPLHGLAPGDGAVVSELPRNADRPGQRAAGAPIRRLQIAWPAGARRLTVLLLPDCDCDELALPVAPLDHWLARRPVRLTGLPRRGWLARSARTPTHASPVRLATSKLGYHSGYAGEEPPTSRDHA
ncbi:MAG TPA: heparinase II/III family protein [Stellaceae bacterium]